jgi:hypothetical protein
VAILRTQRSRKALTVRGTATSPCSTLAGVEVSVVRMAGKRCAHFTGRGFARPAACRRFRFFRARGLQSWSFKVRRPGRGRFAVRARAYDTGGVRSATTKARAR